MPGNPGESADAAAIQEALMDVLSGWTLHVRVRWVWCACRVAGSVFRVQCPGGWLAGWWES